MMGHIVPDSINTSIANMNKFYSKSAVKFGIELAANSEVLDQIELSPASKNVTGRFYDAITGRSETTIQSSGMTQSERTFLSLSTIIDSTNYTTTINSSDNSITFQNVSIATPPSNFPALDVNDFQVFINGVFVEPSAITSIGQVGSNVLIDFNNSLGQTITNEMEITAVGKFEV